MLNEVYNKRILQFASDIPLLERLSDPDASAIAVSRLCGSKVSVDITMDGDVVTGFGHDVKACALGQASSSIMARNVIGSTADELRRVRAEMQAMLKDGGPPPDEQSADAGASGAGSGGNGAAAGTSPLGASGSSSPSPRRLSSRASQPIRFCVLPRL